MNVDTKTDLISIEVIDWVEMTKESVTDEEKVFVLARKTAFMNNEEAFTFIRLVKVLFWINLENEIAHLETNWLDMLWNFFTWLGNMAESLITLTVQIRKRFRPFSLDLLENIWRNRELGATGIDNCRIASGFTFSLYLNSTISHSLSFKGPGTEPVLEILECLKTLCTTNNLRAVVATKQGIRSLVHLLRSDTKWYNAVIDNSVILKGP